MKRVVIVGAGYAGTMVARALDSVAEVHLIEPRDRFVHNVAAIRAVVDPSLLKRLIIPYDRLLRRGSVIQGLAAIIEESGVILADGTTVEGDIVVAATGSTYAHPFKPQSASVAAFAGENEAAHEAARAARTIAIIGGGPVGVELAGEITAAYPDKKVSLFASSSDLLPGYSPKLSVTLVQQLKARGVTLELGHRAECLKSFDQPFAGGFTTAGRNVEADLVFPAIGARPVAPPIANAEFMTSGRLKVDAWLRPSGLRNVFVLGDAAETGDFMTIVGISRQAPWLAKTIKGVLAGRVVETLPSYVPWPTPVILVPLGPNTGASQLPVTRRGLIVGSRVTGFLKGRDLFILRYRRDFGYPATR